MGYEAARFLQFLLSLGLVFAAFVAGMYVGWRRWGRPVPLDHSTEVPVDLTDASRAGHPTTARPNLFAPELRDDVPLDVVDSDIVDLRVDPSDSTRGLPRGSPSEGS